MDIEVLQTRLNSRIEELHDALMGSGADVSTIFEDESRLFVKQVIRLTPPKTKAQGESAIDRDMMKLFEPVNGDFLDDLVIEHGANNIDTWLTSAGGEKKHIKFTYVDNTGGPMKNFHYRNRDSRGRAYSLKRQRDPGIWYAPYVVSYENFTAYANKMKARVGRRKAAWAVSLTKLGGKVASWINRHVSGAKGEYHNSFNLEKPSIVMINRAPGIMSDERIVRSALRARHQAIGKRLRLVISGYSKDVASGIRVARKDRATSASFQEAA